MEMSYTEQSGLATGGEGEVRERNVHCREDSVAECSSHDSGRGGGTTKATPAFRKRAVMPGEHFFGCNTRGDGFRSPEVHGFVRRGEGVSSESRRHGCSSTQMERQRGKHTGERKRWPRAGESGGPALPTKHSTLPAAEGTCSWADGTHAGPCCTFTFHHQRDWKHTHRASPP